MFSTRRGAVLVGLVIIALAPGVVDVAAANGSVGPGPVTAGRFMAAGPLTLARYMHTSTLLADGKVLVAGGYAPTGLTDTAEIYDPATNAFQRLNAVMSVPRGGATATRLSDGRVLITGGYTPEGIAATAELFDPATRTFSAHIPMRSARAEHTATLLKDGTVLLAGGNDTMNGQIPGRASNTAELFDPQKGEFVDVEPMSGQRAGETATLLPDGRVLIAGGYYWAGVFAAGVDTADLYDPATRSFSALPKMTSVRYEQAASPLPDGRVLIAGGSDGNGIVASAETFDPATKTFTALPARMVSPRAVPTATVLQDGRVLLAGGQNGLINILLGFSNTAEVFDPTVNAFLPLAVGVMSDVRSLHADTLLADGRVLLSGGCCTYPPPAYIKSADLFEPDVLAGAGTGR